FKGRSSVVVDKFSLFYTSPKIFDFPHIRACVAGTNYSTVDSTAKHTITPSEQSTNRIVVIVIVVVVVVIILARAVLNIRCVQVEIYILTVLAHAGHS